MIINDTDRRISLASPYFDDMRADLNASIINAVRAMNQTGVDSGSVTLKIDFSILKTTTKDNNSPTGMRQRIVPDINYKVTLAIQAKDERKGGIVDSSKELIADDTGAYFIVTKEEASGQLNMFNCYDELCNEPRDVDLEDDDPE